MTVKGKQVRNGKAFEYAIAMQYGSYLQNAGKSIRIAENNALDIAKGYFEGLNEEEKTRFRNAAYNTIATLLKIEPGLSTQKDANDILSISLNDDSAGETGDVRDIVLKRNGWEIGFSAKNNNDAMKHSRLGRELDFGNAWFNSPCSENYWSEIKPIFDYLEECINNRCTWNDLGQNKKDKVYVPLLVAFRNELLKINAHNADTPKKLVEYLIGKQPFYKIIKDDRHNLVIVKAFNINGKLNKTYNGIKSEYTTPKISLPERIVEFDFKRGSATTLNMILDGGWEISFRLHNADKYVERSLKFDIQLLGNPPVLFTQHLFQ